MHSPSPRSAGEQREDVMPLDAWVEVALYLQPRDVARLARVSRRLLTAMEATMLWELMILRDAPSKLLDDMARRRNGPPEGFPMELYGILPRRRRDGNAASGGGDEAVPLSNIREGAMKALYRRLRFEIHPVLSELTQRMTNTTLPELRLDLQYDWARRPIAGIRVRLGFMLHSFNEGFTFEKYVCPIPEHLRDGIPDFPSSTIPARCYEPSGSARSADTPASLAGMGVADGTSSPRRRPRGQRLAGPRQDRVPQFALAADCEQRRCELFRPAAFESQGVLERTRDSLHLVAGLQDSFSHVFISGAISCVTTLYGMQPFVALLMKRRLDPLMRPAIHYVGTKVPLFKRYADWATAIAETYFQQPFWDRPVKSIPFRKLLAPSTFAATIAVVLGTRSGSRGAAVARVAFVALGALRAFALASHYEVATHRFAAPAVLRLIGHHVVAESVFHLMLQSAVVYYVRALRLPMRLGIAVLGALSTVVTLMRLVRFRTMGAPPMRTVSLSVAAFVINRLASPMCLLALSSRVLVRAVWDASSPIPISVLDEAVTVNDNNGMTSHLAGLAIRTALSCVARAIESAVTANWNGFSQRLRDDVGCGRTHDALTLRKVVALNAVAVVEEFLGCGIEQAVSIGYGSPFAGIAVRAALKAMQVTLYTASCMVKHRINRKAFTFEQQHPDVNSL